MKKASTILDLVDRLVDIAHENPEPEKLNLETVKIVAKLDKMDVLHLIVALTSRVVRAENNLKETTL